MVENRTQWKVHTKDRSHADDHLRSEQRVPSEGEEIVVMTDPHRAEDALPDFGEELLTPRRWRVSSCPDAGFRRGVLNERAPIDLAVWREWQCLVLDPGRRHHEGGQVLLQVRAQRGGVEHRTVGHDDMADETRPAARVWSRSHRSRRHARSGLQVGLDLRQLDTEPTHFDLLVVTADERQLTVRIETNQVAGPIDASFGQHRERVTYETFRSLFIPAAVAARNQRTTDKELANHADRHGLSTWIEHIDLGVADRGTDSGSTPAPTACASQAGTTPDVVTTVHSVGP